ncbi:dodecin domain-containing protein [Enhygromyxa salina]|uniref:dodecin domain-containing protein n=1 Tax=Enhygromyxa salina TaxID=215803 RepID=UPI0015E5BD4E|nr:dodecin domain-containing protein [Enhygromyxa salina]
MIRIVASSTTSFDDAVKSGISQLCQGPHHKNLRFTNYEVVGFQGTIQHDVNSCEVMLYQVVMDVAGDHMIPAPT